MRRYAPVELLTADHDRSTFDCGSAAQTDWLRRYALIAQQSDTARVYVTHPSDDRRVAGYYALAAGAAETGEAPSRLRAGVGRHAVPVVILTRLGVNTRDQGQGLGSALVRDAFLQTAASAERIGAWALLIHAETADVARFYTRLDAAFEPSPTDPLHLVLLMKDLRVAIRKAGAMRHASGAHENDNPTVSDG